MNSLWHPDAPVIQCGASTGVRFAMSLNGRSSEDMKYEGLHGQLTRGARTRHLHSTDAGQTELDAKDVRPADTESQLWSAPCSVCLASDVKSKRRRRRTAAVVHEWTLPVKRYISHDTPRSLCERSSRKWSYRAGRPFVRTLTTAL